MQDLNQVSLIGRVGRDPEVRYTQSGSAIANLSVATSESWKDKSGEKQERTEWHNISFFGGLVDVVEKYVNKGDLIFIQGSLRTRSWEDKDGNKRQSTEVVVGVNGRLQMLSGKPTEHGGRLAKKRAPDEYPRIEDPLLDESLPF